MYKLQFIVITVFLINFCYGQLPETDIWLFKIKKEKELLVLKKPKNLTDRKGYDNQPFFMPDNKNILYVSIRDDNQADVYNYSISKKVSTQLIKTKVSEYSPKLTPNKKHISCVVVEEDSTQRIWLYNLDGSKSKCYDEELDSIGYYSWYSNDTLLYYKLTEPHSLRMKTLQEDSWIADQPIRAFYKLEGNYLIYAIKDSSFIQIRKFNTTTKRSDIIARYNGSNEDIVWNKNLGLLISEGAKILRYNFNTHLWDILFDCTSFGIKKISRFTFDTKNKQLVIVENQ